MSNSALIEDLERQFSENPRRVFARLANEYRKSGNLEGAIALCREHVPRHPGYISGHIVLGQALFESGEILDARQAFEAALQLDPENLIALRHLGDIARRSGHLHEASTWYQRLLEVDPQNEEAAAQLHLLQAGAPLPAASAGAAPQPASEERPVEPSRTPEPEADAALIDAPVAWSDINPERVPAESDELAAVSEVLSTVEGELPPVSPGDPLSFGEVDFGAAPQPADAAALESDPVQPVAGQGVSSEMIEEALDDLAFPAESVPSPRLPANEDMVTAETRDETNALPPVDIVPERDPFEAAEEQAQPFDFSMPSEDVVTLDEREQARTRGDASADVFGWPDAEADEPREHTLEFSDHPSASDPDSDGIPEYVLPEEQGEPALVTETVAALYERQGHLAQSLEVYRQLAAQNPHNEALRLHVARLETELEAAAPPRSPGPSVRAVFKRVLDRRPPVSAPATTLFPHAAASSEDDRAASALAGAFAPEFTTSEPESGRPTRAAKDELSLDAIFGKSHPRSPERGGEDSFDDFFPAAPPRAEEQGAKSSPDSGADDDEIFHSWLDGLKR